MLNSCVILLPWLTMSFKLIVVQFSSHWQTYQSRFKQIWKVVKRFNANSISKVRKLLVAGLVSAALAGPLVWVGPDYNGMVSPGLYLPGTKNALLCQMHDWISSAAWHTFGEKYWFTFQFNFICACRMQNDCSCSQVISCFSNSCLGICINRLKVITTDWAEHKARY